MNIVEITLTSSLINIVHVIISLELLKLESQTSNDMSRLNESLLSHVNEWKTEAAICEINYIALFLISPPRFS